MRSSHKFLLCLFLPLFSSCISAQHYSAEYVDTAIPFSLHQPSLQMNLPYALAEISGLEYYDGHLLAVQDEAGTIFYIHPQTGRIENKLRLFGEGDAEGVASNGETLFLNTSEGLIFGKDPQVKEDVQLLGASLPAGGDYEALTWDKAAGTLLIATKDNLKGDDYPGKNRYVFSVEATAPFSHELFLTIDYKLLKNYLQVDDKDIIHYANLQAEYDKPKPSGLAIDPLTGRIYILNDSGKTLLVYARDGTLKAVALLCDRLFAKPEGITFDPEGNLYISNEQKTGPANILFFKRQH